MHAHGGFALPSAAPSAPLVQRPVVRRVLAALAVAFAAATFWVAIQPADTFAWSPGNYDSGSEQELLTRTNQARASAGRRALRWDSDLASIARSRSKDMIERGYFSHEIAGSGRHVWDLMSDRGYCYRLAGENIGWNQHWPDGQETAEIQKSFMGSPGHRENLLGPDWDVVGIGAYKGADGKAMWTVVFADKCGAVAAASTSKPSTATTASAKKPTVTVPTTPGPRLVGSLTSIRQAGRTVTWRWAALDARSGTSRRACSFDVLYRDNAAPWKFLRTRTTARSISIAGRTPGHTYTVRVRPRDCAGKTGSWSRARAFTVTAG
jgi:uncharacterized protein YkwD